MPAIRLSDDLRHRRLIGLPASFSTLGFDRRKFLRPPEAFESQSGGYDWLDRNLSTPGVSGRLLPLSMVYERLDRTRGRTPAMDDRQASLELALLFRAHEDLLGPLSEAAKEAVGYLGGRTEVRRNPHLAAVRSHIRDIIQAAPAQERRPLHAMLAAVLTEIERDFFHRNYQAWRRSKIKVDEKLDALTEAIGKYDRSVATANGVETLSAFMERPVGNSG